MPEFNPTIHGNLRQPKSRGKRKNLIGQTFNRLTPIGFLGMDTNQSLWLCDCECGKLWVATLQRLRNGQSQSCGCWNLVKPSVVVSHGMSRTHPYRIWSGIKNRILNPNNKSFDQYGGRGLTLCEGMSTFEGFFFIVRNPPTPTHSIDRWPNNATGGYWCGECLECLSKEWPKNWRWATPLEQGGNRRDNRPITIGNETHHLSEWARLRNLKPATVVVRLNYLGWSEEESLGFKEHVRRARRRYV